MNQLSFIVTACVVLLVAWLFVRRRAPRVRWTALAIVVVLATVFALGLRTGPGDVPRTGDFDRVVGHGQPVALEFYSNY